MMAMDMLKLMKLSEGLERDCPDLEEAIEYWSNLNPEHARHLQLELRATQTLNHIVRGLVATWQNDRDKLPKT